ncbi:hypothetical protein TRFO_31914 [Tritrichomonas foetus]|uniref:Armadillo repeat-containing domain-containing protein n=1 Tax=Tritrichomonas foetus TaxID=1144522 RepID=A0A1J4JS80_9EUKA|nr:hypothetical protein TRFO_31914 [Tritrichomonas foetus]|eukprot:OHT01288.1 hypothetical protein TRFO_31914 [Tritrichomonas foetus]
MINDNSTPSGLMGEVSTHFQKIKSIGLSENEAFKFDESHSHEIPTDDEISGNKNLLFGDDPDMQSMAINFFSQALMTVNQEIISRILSLSNSNDTDLIESIIDFLCNAIKSREFPIDILTSLNTPVFLLTIIQNSQDVTLQSAAIYAIFLFSKRSQIFALQFINQGVVQKCCEIIHHSLLAKGNIQLISRCLVYMNHTFKSLENCDSLAPSAIPLYQELLSKTINNKVIGELTLNSLRFFIMQCSDAVLAQMLNESFVNLLDNLVTASEESAILVLNLFVSISFHSSAFSLPILPILEKIIQQDFSQCARAIEIKLTLLATLRNLAANDDPHILEFMVSQPVMLFLQHSVENQPYAILKQAVFVFAYLSNSAIDSFQQHIWENNKNVIITMFELLDINDLEAVLNCFETVRNLLIYLQKTNEASFVECVQMLMSLDAESIIQDVLDSCVDSPNLIALADELCNILVSI